MALELVKLDSGTLPAIANAIRAKTGDTALLLPSQMPNAIAGIPSGIELPALTTPAAAGDVIAGKEYIDGVGAKRTGTLVVCDTVVEAGTVSNPGVGLEVDIESIADASASMLTLPEPNLKPENIKSGTSIFNVAGSVKEIRTETGTITLAEDAQAPEVIHNLGVIPDLIIVEAEYHENTAYSILGFMAVRPALLSSTLFGGIIFTIGADGNERGAFANDNGQNAFNNGLSDTGFVCAYNSSSYKYRAGWTYKWKVFAWLT